MSYDLLQRTAHAALPMTIDHPSDINMLRAYVAARLVQADIPAPVRTGHRFLQPAATVHGLTPRGHDALAALAATPPLRQAPRQQPAASGWGWAAAGQPA